MSKLHFNSLSCSATVDVFVKFRVPFIFWFVRVFANDKYYFVNAQRSTEILKLSTTNKKTTRISFLTTKTICFVLENEM